RERQSQSLPCSARRARLPGAPCLDEPSAVQRPPQGLLCAMTVRLGDAAEQLATDDELAHFGCACTDLQQFRGAEQAVDFRFPDGAAATVDLHGLREHAAHGLGGIHHRGGGQCVDVAAAAAADVKII